MKKLKPVDAIHEITKLFAKMYTLKISERVKRGLEAKKKEDLLVKNSKV